MYICIYIYICIHKYLFIYIFMSHRSIHILSTKHWAARGRGLLPNGAGNHSHTSGCCIAVQCVGVCCSVWLRLLQRVDNMVDILKKQTYTRFYES